VGGGRHNPNTHTPQEKESTESYIYFMDVEEYEDLAEFKSPAVESEAFDKSTEGKLAAELHVPRSEAVCNAKLSLPTDDTGFFGSTTPVALRLPVPDRAALVALLNRANEIEREAELAKRPKFTAKRSLPRSTTGARA